MARRFEHERQINVLCENIDCDQPASLVFTPSQFRDWLGVGEFKCRNCGHEFSVEKLQITCALCTAEIDYLNLDNLANDILCDPCPECAAARWVNNRRGRPSIAMKQEQLWLES